MSIYLIKHSVKDFTGYFGGVDFYQGRGSTSSEGDAQKLKGLGCYILEPGMEVVETQDKGAADAAPASPSPALPPPEEVQPPKGKAGRPRKKKE